MHRLELKGCNVVSVIRGDQGSEIKLEKHYSQIWKCCGMESNLPQKSEKFTLNNFSHNILRKKDQELKAMSLSVSCALV